MDVLDEHARFITSADCQLQDEQGARWGGVLTAIEPNAHLGSGRYRIRSRTGVEASILIQARQRIGKGERYPFVGVGQPPPTLDPD